MPSLDNNTPHIVSSSNNLAVITTEDRDVCEQRVAKPDPAQLKRDEIIAQVAYCGLNHIDVSQIRTGAYITHYPYVLGKEWSGQILYVGSEVTDLRPGDWVLGLGYKNGGLQEQVTTSRMYVCSKPDKLSPEHASTIPHRYTTAMVALHTKEGLNLPFYPTESEKAEHKVLIWGAATGSGMYAIQILQAAGYKTILAVASTKQQAKLDSIGATEVFDRNDSSVVQNILAKHADISLALVCQADDEGWENLLEVVRPTERKEKPVLVVHIIRSMPSIVPRGVTLKRSVAFAILDDREVGDYIIQTTLPKLLALPNFQIPKDIKVFKDGTFVERVNAAVSLLQSTGEVNAAIRVSSP